MSNMTVQMILSLILKGADQIKQLQGDLHNLEKGAGAAGKAGEAHWVDQARAINGMRATAQGAIGDLQRLPSVVGNVSASWGQQARQIDDVRTALRRTTDEIKQYHAAQRVAAAPEERRRPAEAAEAAAAVSFRRATIS